LLAPAPKNARHTTTRTSWIGQRYSALAGGAARPRRRASTASIDHASPQRESASTPSASVAAAISWLVRETP